MRPRVLVVSYHAANPLTPRGARTQAVAAALAQEADVRVLAAPSAPARRTWGHRARDRALAEIGTRWMIDPVEPWAWRTLGRRRIDADLALLIGYPFSPLVVAARALRRQGVPYVVDMSDPWSRIRTDGQARTARARRGARLERELWAGAAAGILTTSAQARDVLEDVPGLAVLVRPNGYTGVAGVPGPRRREDRGELRIGHFGSLYAQRGDMTHFVRRLAQSGLWRRVVLIQYGGDDRGDLRVLSQWIAVERRDPVPWPEIVRRAAPELDAALVVGNTDVRQLPSKAIEYLTLPLPRVALSRGPAADALADYVDGKPGWLVTAFDDPDPGRRLWDHLERGWTAEELAPPPGEAWGPVAEQIASFVLRHAGPGTGAPLDRHA
jgi:hypothetical protein